MDHNSKVSAGRTRRNEYQPMMNNSMILPQKKHQGFRNEQAQHMFVARNY